jgi:cytochrome c553
MRRSAETHEGVRGLWQTLHLAAQVGDLLGAGALLQRTLPPWRPLGRIWRADLGKPGRDCHAWHACQACHGTDGEAGSGIAGGGGSASSSSGRPN